MELSQQKLQALKTMADRLRHHSIIATSEAGSGHPTSCMSCAELVSALFFHFLRYDLENPNRIDNDRFVLSKGHAAPILWAALGEAGAFSLEKLKTLRQIDSILDGHPTPLAPWVDVATGSLGQGLSAGLGMAIGAKIDRIENHIYVLLGDGEIAEGSVWEAIMLASHRRIPNLTAIVDVNSLGQTGKTMYGENTGIYADSFRSFGWHTREIDGHDIEAVLQAYSEARDFRDGPTAIIAHTSRGKGVSDLENAPGHHGKPIPSDKLEAALEEVGYPDLEVELKLLPPEGSPKKSSASSHRSDAWPPPEYGIGESLATRKAYGNALLKIGKEIPQIVAFDGEVKNSTYSEEFGDKFPERFIESYIAEQNMVGMAMGISAVGKIPFVSTFACFLSRACDQIRMAGISRANIKFCGSHAGISIGEDGPSQMGLEDLAFFRTIPDSIILYPGDAVATERCAELAVANRGIVYLRTARPGTPVIYSAGETFTIGGSHTLRSSVSDRVTVLTAGVTIHEALEAANRLEKDGVAVRVVDLYSVKPIDHATILKAAQETDAIITVEDHYPEGGLGDAILASLAGFPLSFSRKLAVNGLPRSGPADKLMEMYGINANAIEAAIREAVETERRKSA